MSIDRSVWEAAIREVRGAQVVPSTALTTMEFAELMGYSRDHAGKVLNKLVAAGKATRTKKHIQRVDGGVQLIVAYDLVAPPKKKEKQ